MASATNVAKTIDNVAKRLGVNPHLALAIAYVESKLNPNAVGDYGTSYGLYQLHQGGELGNLTPTQALNPEVNATVALSNVRAVQAEYPNASPGEIAALAQRPANPQQYAADVNAAYAQLAGGDSVATLLSASKTSSSFPVTAPGANVATAGISTTLASSQPGFLHQMQAVMNMHGYDNGWLGPLNLAGDTVNLALTIISRGAVVLIGLGLIWYSVHMLFSKSVVEMLPAAATSTEVLPA